jgi:CRISPR/Cas system-associated endonuclease/helicase Cas3
MFEMHKQDGYLENTFSGSKIYFSTLSEDGDKVRGLTLSLVVIDEAQLVDCETMESGVLPTLSTTG